MYVCVCVLPECTHCITYMSSAHVGQREASDLLKLELQIAVSLGGVNQTQVLCKKGKCS